MYFCVNTRDRTDMREKNRKQKTEKRIVYKLILIVLLGIMAFSLYKIGAILYGYYEGNRQYDELAKIAEIDMEEIEHINFKALREKNRDVKAWLYGKDTVINYPVVQGKDNQQYLYVTPLGEWNSKGSIFIDYRCKKPFEDFNTILYGHRMKDGSMFHSLTKYEDRKYFEKHKTMELITPKKNFDVEIFAVVRISSDSPLYRIDFADDGEKSRYLQKISEEGLLDTGVKVSAKDKIIMMSTCTYEFQDARLVVYGKLKEKNK